MPLIPLVVALLLPLVLVLALPFSLVQRYRVGTARRPARRWVATTNFVLMIFSAVVFLWAASLTNFWVPKAFSSALMGFGGGTVLGLLGVALTRWEQTPRGLYYTPNRWLILLLVVAISGRSLYSYWRGWHAWTAGERIQKARQAPLLTGPSIVPHQLWPALHGVRPRGGFVRHRRE